jgi:transposase
MKVDLRAFAGKTIFVGIDVHKTSYAVVVVVDGEVVLKVGSMPADPAKIIEFLKKRFPDSTIRTAYEAGFSGFVLHRALLKAGIESLVVHAAAIEVAANDRVKTDKRDAQKIALQLSRGALRGIRVPTEKEELSRQITRTRAQLVKERARVGIQVKSKLMIFGLIAADDKRTMSASLLEEYRKMRLPLELAAAVSALAAVWETLSEQIELMEAQMQRQARAQPKLEKLYRSAPGIGPTIARVLANELGDMSQFSSAKKLYSFLGLTPSERSSGPNERKGYITRQGPGYLRGLLVESAWMAKAKDPELDALYSRLKVTRGGRRAIVAVARHMVGRLRACLRDGSAYQIEHNRGKAA